MLTLLNILTIQMLFYVVIFFTSQTTAIVVYTSWERHALVGTDVRLSCSFFSWKWTSPDVTFSWHYRSDGARDSIAIFHYTGGVPYVDNKGPFRDRLEFVGNPSRRDGSILIKNVDIADNGTFTCDAKNPPDIAGSPSNVRLLVFENVPVQAGVITGAIIGVVLGLLILIVAIYYLMRFLVARRVFSLSMSKHGKKGKGKEGSQQKQALAVTDPAKLKAAASEKKKQESRREKK
uniref:Myelin protein P0-like n=1 Tax=Sinocyclocheilus anshuiensis TaxID=1608454 RepID=A0A671LYI1_9TELE